MKILAFESSCDETAAAVVEDGTVVLSSVVLSQIETHRRFGGVVPEIASRAHTEAIVPLYEKALSDAGVSIDEIDAVAVTSCPGLIGALLVGVNFAKSLAFVKQKPLVAVNHIEGHIAANYLASSTLEPPFIALCMSGGHTSLLEVRSRCEFHLIGSTRDDAIGEAFDKAARQLGIPYPGGSQMDALAARGRADAIAFPPCIIRDDDWDFTFSGLKTAVINYVHHQKQLGEEIVPEDVAASFTRACCFGLEDRMTRAMERFPYRKLVLAGGVAANSHIRATAEAVCRKTASELFLPPPSLCGDNAAMIASQAYYRFLAGKRADEGLNASATSPFHFKSLR